MTEEQQSINKAFESSSGSYLSIEIQKEIAADYGEAIAAKVKTIYDEAIGCPVDWSRATVDTGLAVMAALLDARYPWLSAGARSQLVHFFVMEWK